MIAIVKVSYVGQRSSQGHLAASVCLKRNTSSKQEAQYGPKSLTWYTLVSWTGIWIGRLGQNVGHYHSYKPLLRFDLLTYFWPLPSKDYYCPRYHQDKHSEQIEEDWVKPGCQSSNKIVLRFDLVIYFLTPSHPCLNLTQILSWQSFWASLRNIGSKLWSLECLQDFTKIWPSDLLFYLILPMFEIEPDTIVAKRSS